MGLRVIYLSELDEDYIPKMSYEEYCAELKKPRSKRRGLSKMPADMCMSPEQEERFIQSAIEFQRQSKAERARTLANARISNCL